MKTFDARKSFYLHGQNNQLKRRGKYNQFYPLDERKEQKRTREEELNLSVSSNPINLLRASGWLPARSKW